MTDVIEKRSEKTYKFLVEFDAKPIISVSNLMQNRQKTRPEAPPSTSEATDRLFSRSFCKNRPKHCYDFEPFWLKNW